jgi:hypothetical protein
MPYLPDGYRVGFSVTRRGLERTGIAGLSGTGCDALLAEAHRLLRLSKTRSKQSHRDAAKAAAARVMASYKLCVASAAPATPTSPQAPPPPAPPPSAPPPVIVDSGSVVGAVPSNYIPSSGGGAPLSVPPPTVYDAPPQVAPDGLVAPTTPSAPAPSAPVVVAECNLESLGMLPMTYSDIYGPMRVLRVFCGPSAPQAVQASSQQTPAQQPPAGFSISSAELWGG